MQNRETQGKTLRVIASICGIFALMWILSQACDLAGWLHGNLDHDATFLQALFLFGQIGCLVTNRIELFPVLKDLWARLVASLTQRRKKVNKNNNGMTPTMKNSERTSVFLSECTRNKTAMFVVRFCSTFAVSIVYLFLLLQHFTSEHRSQSYDYRFNKAGQLQSKHFLKARDAYEKPSEHDWSAEKLADYWQSHPSLDALSQRQVLISRAIMLMSIFLLLRVVKIVQKLDEERDRCPADEGVASELGSRNEEEDSTWTYVSKQAHQGSDQTNGKASTAVPPASNSSHCFKNGDMGDVGILDPISCFSNSFLDKAKLIWRFALKEDGILSRGVLACFLLAISHLFWLFCFVHWYKENSPFFALDIEPTSDLRLIRKAYRSISIKSFPD